MRLTSMSLWVLMALALAPAAWAQSQTEQTATFDEMPQGGSLPVSVAPIDTRDLTRSVQLELKRVGCFPGVVDGLWGDTTKGALANFARLAKLDVATDAPTPVAVDALKSRTDRVCPVICPAGQVEQNGACVAKAPPPAAKAARPQVAAEPKRAPRANPDNERPSSGMCLRNDGRGQALVPCSEAPGARRVY
ncbi:MAG: peptidoglycan-binding protein [Hyphomicrobiales bacterium]|nr:MAG: peptidoglycan-binding protein [Hyphomicrobiales bacterium]